MSKSVTTALLGILFVLVLVLFIGAVWLVFAGGESDEISAEEAVLVSATATNTANEEATELPTAEIVVLPSLTPIPTSTSSPTPPPTETPESTATPTETAVPPTNTPAPAPVLPTNTPVPPAAPTNTPAPTSPPANTQGVTATNFAIQPRAVLQVNQPVWFEFSIKNDAGGPVPFGALGVMPRKDGVDRPEWYQNSWGGNNDAIPANGLSWEDNIRLPEAGNYTLRLVICFGGHQACLNGGPWVTLSQEIPVAIN